MSILYSQKNQCTGHHQNDSVNSNQTMFLTMIVLISVISTLIVGVEVITYPNFLLNHFHIAPKLVTLITILFVSPLLLKIKKPLRKLFSIFILGAALMIIGQIILICLESSNFPNYVYSRFHLQIAGFNNLILHLVGLSLVTLLLNKATIKRANRFLIRQANIENLPRRVLFLSILFLWLLFALTNISKDLITSRRVIAEITAQPRASNIDKVKKIHGFFYDYMLFIKNKTEEGSTIAIPPTEYPWAKEGNPAMDLYFLYPRKLVQGSGVNLPLKKVDYILIAKGSWPKEGYENGWPKEKVYGAKIWYIDEKTLSVREYTNTYYTPNSKDNNKSWGLIKINK